MAAHYWDYTLDERKLGEAWYLSKIFDEAWFGNIDSLSNDDHIVDQGRFAFTPVMNARNAGYMNITNPYGLLRSPWNVNKVPFVMRSSYVMGDKYDSFTSLPSCTQFQEYVVPEASYADIVMALNGELHGPVHLMVGASGATTATSGAASPSPRATRTSSCSCPSSSGARASFDARTSAPTTRPCPTAAATARTRSSNTPAPRTSSSTRRACSSSGPTTTSTTSSRTSP